MISTRNTARIVGALFIAQMTTAIISYSVILEPLLFKPDFLRVLNKNSTAVIWALLLDLLTGAFVFAIAVLLYPILKKFSERIALWYAGQRLTEWVGFMVSGLLLLTLLDLGQKIDSSDNPEVLNAIGISLRSARGNLQDIALLLYCLGAWSFYGLLYYTQLLPRFIPLWGIIGVTLLFSEILANVFGTSIGNIMIVGMPLGLNEIFLGGWLIVKGFNPDRTGEH